MDWNTALLIVKQYGPLVLVMCFLLWQSWMRECRMTSRIDKLEDEQRKVLLPLVKKCARVITRNTSIMGRLERSLDARWEQSKSRSQSEV